MRRLIVCVLVVVLAASCVQATPTMKPESDHVLTVIASPEKSATANQVTITPPPSPPFGTATAVTTPLPTLDASRSATLSNTGPWLIFEAALKRNDASYLWAVNKDGSGLTQLSTDPVINFQVVKSPDQQGRIVFMTGVWVSQTRTLPYFEGLTLKEIIYPGWQIRTITRLTSEKTEPTLDNMTTPGNADVWHINRAIAWDGLSFVPSPDGKQLAFIGAMDGSSADVYDYDFEDASITRLTNGPTQAFNPVWSPDGTFIVHLAVNHFGTGAGDDLDSVWAVDSNGQLAEKLYNTTAYSSANEVFRGWLDNTTFLVNSGDPQVGKKFLRVVDIGTGSTSILQNDCFDGAAVEPQSGMIVMVSSSCTSKGKQGIYMRTRSDTEWRRISEVASSVVYWSNVGHYFLVWTEANYWLSVSLSGEIGRIAGPGNAQIEVAPDGKTLAWFDFASAARPAGLWLGVSDQDPAQVYDHDVNGVIWTPDSSGLFFMTDDGLNVVVFPEGKPSRVPRMLYTYPIWRGEWAP